MGDRDNSDRYDIAKERSDGTRERLTGEKGVSRGSDNTSEHYVWNNDGDLVYGRNRDQHVFTREEKDKVNKTRR